MSATAAPVPVHAIELAQELEIPTVVVPQMPGLFSAFGMLVADQTYDLQLPVLQESRRHRGR